jgi:RNase P/RNase MRP subunit POP5
MKPLKPSHREHKRYLLLEGTDALKDNIEQVILKFIGVLGYAESCPQFIKSQKNPSAIILAVNRQALEKIRASFLMSGKDIKIKKVSGILNKL